MRLQGGRLSSRRPTGECGTRPEGVKDRPTVRRGRPQGRRAERALRPVAPTLESINDSGAAIPGGELATCNQALSLISPPLFSGQRAVGPGHRGRLRPAGLPGLPLPPGTATPASTAARRTCPAPAPGSKPTTPAARPRLLQAHRTVTRAVHVGGREASRRRPRDGAIASPGLGRWAGAHVLRPRRHLEQVRPSRPTRRPPAACRRG